MHRSAAGPFASLVWAALLAVPAARAQAPSPPEPPRYEISNGYFHLEGRDGRFTGLRVDPLGRRQYARNLLVDFGIGEPGPSPLLTFQKRGEAEIVLDNVAVRLPDAPTVQAVAEEAVPVRAAGGLGQTFLVADGVLTFVEGKFATYQTTDAQVVLRLRRDGPAGAVLAETRLRGLLDNAWAGLAAADLPPGTYYFEAVEPMGRVGWWASRADRYAGGTAWTDGAAAGGFDFAFRATTVRRLLGRWSLTLADAHLLTHAELLPAPVDFRPLVRFTTTWHRDGTALDHPDIAFARAITSGGQHLPMSVFKRRALWAPTETCAFLHLAGRGAYDLRMHFPQKPGSVRWTLTADAMTFHPSEPSINLEVLPHADWFPDTYPRFLAPDPAFARTLNEFLYDFNFSFAGGANPEWREWLGLALDWTDHPFRARERAILLGAKLTPEGYVHTWGDLAGWPFPDPAQHDTRHFDTNALQIVGTYLYYCWTRDGEFLDAMRPRLRAAMAYQLKQLEGEKGLLVANGREHHGKSGGIGSNYWDILPFGYLSAYENIYFYESLRCLAELERQWGNRERAAELEALRAAVRKRYNETFWRADRGRYIGCIDAEGGEHDYGFVFVNLEAAAHGLADAAQIRRIYKWLEEEPTSSGIPDTYTKWVFAPRATTLHNPGRREDPQGKQGWWFFGWEGTEFGAQCQDGGAILYTSFYDLLVRARAFGAENAFRRFKEILARYAEPDRLAGGSPRHHGETAQGPDPGAVGTDEEFPESGLVPAGFLYYFIGASADIEGLKLRPNLPKAMPWAGVENFAYGGRSFTLKVTPETVELSWPERGRMRNMAQKVPPGGYVLVTPEFAMRAVAAPEGGAPPGGGGAADENALKAVARRHVEERHPDWLSAFDWPCLILDAGAEWQVTFQLPAGREGGVPIVHIDKATQKVTRAEHTR